MVRLGFLLLYYGFFRYLPSSSSRGFLWTRKIRRWCCKGLFFSCGININIEHGASFGSGRQIKIGNNSGLGVNCKLYGSVAIGDNVMMGPEVIILTVNHEFASIEVPMINQGMKEFKPVCIGNDVWIGQRVIILPGVHIGNGVIIGAGSVVSKSIPDYSVVVGNPARIVRSRVS
ncbi:DapH/DapD/GlmU-related protein [Iodobacter arcticus]|uniref:DapH/DapD/GlmU-related protein n=1 Tax=Iodobacter arcticus TaxID=590593 RepID=A0ABW2QWC7_9NEIS